MSQKKYKVLSVITTFFPDTKTKHNLDIIKEQSDLTLVIDNGSSDDKLAFLEEYKNDPKVRIILNEANLGIAYTNNQAAKICLEESFDFLLTFDQDSTPPADYVAKMLEVYETIQNQDSQLFSKLGVLCPVYYFASIDRLDRKNKNNTQYSVIPDSMSSGSLIHRKVFEAGVEFENKLFVDYFDSDFCLKVRKYGFLLAEASEVILDHSLASLKKAKFLNKECIPSNYAPFRRYYRLRNMIFMYVKYFKLDSEWVFRDFRGQVTDVLKLILVEDKKIPKLKGVIFGIWHGLIGKWENPVKIKF